MESREDSTGDYVIEGLVKFRDGKKWKSRWCVIKKVSPVADCVQLVLYRSLTERARGGPHKASLSLRRFLALESGFTLDRESHTLGVVCAEMRALLALSGREQLLAWRGRLARALGGTRALPALLQRAPARSRAPSTPCAVRLHVHRSCATIITGEKPKLVATFDVKDLKRYGVLDGCLWLDAGERCGKLSGAWALKADKPQLLLSALKEAALYCSTSVHNDMADDMSIHRFPFDNKTQKDSNDGTSIKQFELTNSWSHDINNYKSEAGSSIGLGDSISMSDVTEKESRRVNRQIPGRCVSCMSQIGAPPVLLRPHSSSPANWATNSVIESRSDSDRTSLCSRSSGRISEYSVPSNICVTDKSNRRTVVSSAGCLAPNVPPKSCCVWSCRRPQTVFHGPYENYDTPRSPLPLIHENPPVLPSAVDNYDVPKKFNFCLLTNSQTCDCLANIFKKEETASKSLPSVSETDGQSAPSEGCDSNYVNIEPSNDEEDLKDLSATLEKYESSAQILMSAGFSQEEIDDLDETFLSNDNDKTIVGNQLNYLCMEPLGLQVSSRPRETKNIDDFTQSKRKSTSSDFLQKVDEFLDVTKSISFKDVSVNLPPIRKFSDNEVFNNEWVHVEKQSIDTCLKLDLSIDDTETEKTMTEDSSAAKIKEVKIRRSSSAPSKNRDSASSNDSGVSTGSLKHHRCCHVSDESEAHGLRTSKMNRNVLDLSLSVTAGSVNPMQRISFQFGNATSSDAATAFDTKKNLTGCILHGRNIPSPGSCDSEFSDFFESLSLSSVSSVETSSRSTGRPRSGREYSSLPTVQRQGNSCTCCP